MAAATVDNLNVLDALTGDNIAYALFPTTSSAQTLTIDSSFLPSRGLAAILIGH
jgi:hypothetical protein